MFSLGDIRIHCTVSIIQRSFSIFLCVFVVSVCEFWVRNTHPGKSPLKYNKLVHIYKVYIMY